EPAPEPEPPPDPEPSDVARELLKQNPVPGLTEKALTRVVDRTADYVGSLEGASAELTAVLKDQTDPAVLDRYLDYLKLADGDSEEARGAVQHLSGKPDAPYRRMLESGHFESALAELQWLQKAIPSTADLSAEADRYLELCQLGGNRPLYEQARSLPFQQLRRLVEIGVPLDRAVGDLAHVAGRPGAGTAEFELLCRMREETPDSAEALKALDYLIQTPAGPARDEKERTYLKLIQVASDEAEALRDLQWFSADRPAGSIESSVETYLELLGRVDPQDHAELREAYSKIRENAPDMPQPRGWFRKPVTCEGAFGTLLEFEQDPGDALTDLRLLQKHSPQDLRTGLKDLSDLFKTATARDGDSVRRAYELLQSPPPFMDRQGLKKLITRYTLETDDLGLGSRLAAMLTRARTEGEFVARRKAFGDYLELGRSIPETVELLDRTESYLPPTDGLLKIHPFLLELVRERPVEVVSKALEPARAALDRGRVQGKSSADLFRSYLGLLARCQHPSEVDKLGEVLENAGQSAWQISQIFTVMLDAFDGVSEAVEEFHFVARTVQAEQLEDLGRAHAGTIMVLRQTGRRDAVGGSRELMSWALAQVGLPTRELLVEVGRRLVMGVELEKAKQEALDLFQGNSLIREKEDHVIIGGVRVEKRQ
ncbi:MAG: hypothetical protein AB1758_04975, partial [Candidatus Eremiobacterota bacterium]